MNGQTSPDNNGHVRRDERTDNTPLKGVSVRCPVRRPTRKEIRQTREALRSMFGLKAERDDLPFHRHLDLAPVVRNPHGSGSGHE
jgi:hypothetical protein